LSQPQGQSSLDGTAAEAAEGPAQIAAVAPDAPMIELAEGRPVPDLLGKLSNPYSAGHFPLSRKFTVGDTVTWRLTDLYSGAQERITLAKVTRVDPDNDRVELNGGIYVMDTMGNILIEPTYGESDVPRQFVPAELYVGNKWSAGWKLKKRDGTSTVSWDLRIAAFERIRLAFGEIDAFRIEATGLAVGQKVQSLTRRIWIAPGIDYHLRNEWIFRVGSNVTAAERSEMISLRQYAFDLGCASSRNTNSKNLAATGRCS